MTEQEYNQHEGVRRSDLWKIRESPEKYLWAIEHPEEPTPALIFGAMVHKMLLEPLSFANEYAVAPNVDRRTKAGKEAWQAFTEQNSGKVIISADDFDQADAMVNRVMSHPIAQKLLGGRAELPLFWTDEDTTELCKVRLDMLKQTDDGEVFVVDYKTAASAETNRFNSKLFEFGYHLQAYMYTEAVRRCYELKERPRFIFIVQEKKPPYAVNCIEATEDVITAGMDVFRELIGILHQCKETGYWYGYNGAFDDINEAYLPGYMTMGDEDE